MLLPFDFGKTQKLELVPPSGKKQEKKREKRSKEELERVSSGDVDSDRSSAGMTPSSERGSSPVSKKTDYEIDMEKYGEFYAQLVQKHELLLVDICKRQSALLKVFLIALEKIEPVSLDEDADVTIVQNKYTGIFESLQQELESRLLKMKTNPRLYNAPEKYMPDGYVNLPKGDIDSYDSLRIEALEELWNEFKKDVGLQWYLEQMKTRYVPLYSDVRASRSKGKKRNTELEEQLKRNTELEKQLKRNTELEKQLKRSQAMLKFMQHQVDAWHEIMHNK